MQTKFLVFTDLHVDIMHDSVARMEIICNAAVRENVDFILHLGDIMYPEVDFLAQHAPDSLHKREGQAWFVCDRDDEKLAVKKLLANTGKKVYGTLGNHDMDGCDKETACRYWDMPGPYYDFVQNGIRFLALDTNNIFADGAYIPYEHCNYRHYKSHQVTFLQPEQLAWLKDTVASSQEPCVLVSHAPLGDELLNVNNMRDVWGIIDDVNQHDRKIILGINGHNHVDGLSVRHGVPFLSINSASNIWLGKPYSAVRYSQTLCKSYPFLPMCAPYYNPLYSIITIDEKTIRTDGVQSSFVGAAPQSLGFPKDASYFDPCACIRSRLIPRQGLPGDGTVDDYIVDGD